LADATALLSSSHDFVVWCNAFPFVFAEDLGQVMDWSGEDDEDDSIPRNSGILLQLRILFQSPVSFGFVWFEDDDNQTKKGFANAYGA
jgi:hypothetical protein